MAVTYLHLPAGRAPPSMEGSGPFKAVLVLDQFVTAEWQTLVSDWLVRSGCLYMMAWGPGCGSWDDSVDYANLAAADFAEVPDDRHVLTTWHDDEPLSDTFWFAGQCAVHPTVPFKQTLIIDINADGREAELLAAYSEAQTGI
ncbi:MAG: DUF7684 family protein [Brevundimonas sp.]